MVLVEVVVVVDLKALQVVMVILMLVHIFKDILVALVDRLLIQEVVGAAAP